MIAAIAHAVRVRLARNALASASSSFAAASAAESVVA